ncbi:hypothetical protein ACNAWD_11915 [Rhodococcus erythropolis]|uniref:Secreted protein n=1 Tax=Rhodococcus erythropolis TaxID=1833 RepID=A0A8I1D5M5_RHOER|nr:hypothetical protein [Rhodococcus erythropolis]MBH5141599.1 hypothetical protein [Rhodococcus erythropolis]MBS2988445.1 hypothetical protein [Rhodococcus erythropolis]ORI16572.1 hypothetical protein BH686_13345 [Rhodococcus erythropolis]
MSINSTRRVGVVVALLGAAALTAPAIATALPSTGSLGSSAPEASCSTLSTEATPNGWGIPFTDEKDQTASYSADNVLDKDGSLKLAVDSTGDRSVSYHSAGGIKLSDAVSKAIGFAERAATPTAAFQLRLTGTTGGKFENGFTTLVWVPGPDATPTADGGVHADLQKGVWWSTQNIDGAKDRVSVPLADIVAANPKAVVDHYGVSVGTGSAATSTLVDAVQFNGCTTNFAKKDPASGTGSLGDVFGSLFGS